MCAPPCRLAELGFTKLFNEIDMKEAARQGLLGLGSKPLDTEHIQGFLEDFGLDAEFGVHSRIRGLSGARTAPRPPGFSSLGLGLNPLVDPDSSPRCRRCLFKLRLSSRHMLDNDALVVQDKLRRGSWRV